MSASRSLLVIASLLASSSSSLAIQEQTKQNNLRSSAASSSSDRNLKSAAQKAAKEAAGTHYYEIKAKTTKDVPDSGLNSATSSESDAEVSEVVEVSLDTDFEKKEDKRESRKADKKAREEAESTGATVHTWNGETRRGLAGSPTKSPSSGLHKVDNPSYRNPSPKTVILTDIHSILIPHTPSTTSLPGSLHPNPMNTVSCPMPILVI